MAMRFDFAFFANSAEVLPTGLMYVLGGGFDLLKGPSFPAPLPNLFLLVRLTVEPAECGPNHELICEIVRPTGQSMPPESKVPFVATRHVSDVNRATPITICLAYQNIIIPEAGEYIFRLSVDGVPMGAAALLVVQDK
jgi:hypothetical protein